MSKKVGFVGLGIMASPWPATSCRRATSWETRLHLFRFNPPCNLVYFLLQFLVERVESQGFAVRLEGPFRLPYRLVELAAKEVWRVMLWIQSYCLIKSSFNALSVAYFRCRFGLVHPQPRVNGVEPLRALDGGQGLLWVRGRLLLR